MNNPRRTSEADHLGQTLNLQGAVESEQWPRLIGHDWPPALLRAVHDVCDGDIKIELTALLQQRADCPCLCSVQSIDDGARQAEQDFHAEFVASGNQCGRTS